MPKVSQEKILDHIVNVLINDHVLDDKAVIKLRGKIHKITDIELKKCLNECLEIRLQIDKFSEQINEGVITDKLNQEEKSIVDNIKKVNINGIISSIKDVKKQINSIKVKFQSDVKKLNDRLEQNELKEKEKIAQERESQEQQGASSSASYQAPTKEIGAIPKWREERKRYSVNKKEDEQLQKQKEENRQNQEKQKVEQERYTKCCMLLNTKTIKNTVIHTMCNNILRLYNEKNRDKAGYECLLRKESKKFELILDCYIKLYTTFTKILDVVEVEKTLALGSDFSKAENKFKRLKEDQKSSFNGLLSIFKKEKGKIKIDEVKDHFNSIINALSKHIDIPVFSYSDIPSIDNICEIKDDLVKYVPTLTKEKKKEDDLIINKRFTIVLNCTLHKNGYKEKVDKVIEELTKQHSPNSKIEGASAKQDSACAQIRK